jgi:hypothetical protein
MNELEPDLKALLLRAKGELSPRPNDTTRIASRLDGALHPAVRDPGESTRARATEAWVAGVVGVLLGLTGGTGIGLFLADGGESAPPPNGSSVEVAAALVASLPNSIESNDAKVALPFDSASVVTKPPPSNITTEGRKPDRASTRTLNKQPAGRPKVDAGSTLDEVEQVRRVRRALSHRDAALALLLLDQLDRAVPNGRLMQERDAGRAIARCIQEPRSGAATRAAFEHRHPASVHQARVSSVCKE